MILNINNKGTLAGHIFVDFICFSAIQKKVCYTNTNLAILGGYYEVKLQENRFDWSCIFDHQCLLANVRQRNSVDIEGYIWFG